jgi:ATP-dependent Clp protease ATP-binding subunit ClpA
MFELYTKSARRTMELARHEAIALSSAEIGTAHVLFSLLSDPVLVNEVMAGISRQDVRDEIRANLAHHAIESPPQEQPLGHELKEALVLARRYAQEHSHRYVNNYYILLAFMQTEDCAAAKVLKARDLSYDYTRDVVRSLQERENEEHALESQEASVEAYRAAPDLEDLWLLAIELSQLDNYRDTLNLIDSAIADPRFERNRSIRKLAPIAAAVARTIGDLESAKRYYELELSCSPDKPLALYGLACCLQEQGNADEANTIARRTYQLSTLQGGEVGKGLAEMLEKRFPNIASEV